MSVDGSYKKLAAANLQRIEQYVRRIEQLLSRATGRFVSLSTSVPYDRAAGDQFYFADYPEISKEVDKLVSSLARGIESAIVAGTTAEWAHGTEDANGILDYVLKRAGIKDKEGLKDSVIGQYLNNHSDALKAFQKRQIGGITLSQKVWNLANQTKIETELARSIADGTSARALAESMQEYLQEPSKLFRRVRDEFGVLRLSRNARAYNPGEGVYRSSYKNALRLARTEINMAYRTAEQTSYADKEYVVGIEIKRSNNPYDCPLCEALAGKYPKDFKWSGWHPNCRCYMVPITVTNDEFIDMLGDEEFSPELSKNYVGDVPDSFKEWYEQNQDRILASYANGNTPYFIKDNELLMQSFSGGQLDEFSGKYHKYQQVVEGGRYLGFKIDDYTPRQLMQMSSDEFTTYYEEKRDFLHDMMADYTASKFRVNDLLDYMKKHVNPGIDANAVADAGKKLQKNERWASLREKIMESLGIQETKVLDGLGSDPVAYMKTLTPGNISDLELRSFVRVVCNSEPELATIKRISTGYNEDLFAYCAKGEELFLSRTTHKDCGMFKMTEDLKGAISAILSKKEMTFNQEYAVECLWHEMKHGTALGWTVPLMKRHDTIRNAMETVNQYCARREYHTLLGKLGGKAIHLNSIKDGGYGYGNYVKNFGSVLSHYSIKEQTAYSYLSSAIQTSPYEDMYDVILDFLKLHTKGQSEDTLILTIDAMFGMTPEDFLAKLTSPKGFARL